MRSTVAFVTGANGVIGSAIASELLRRGARVCGADLDPAPQERLAEAAKSSRFRYATLDVRDPQSWEVSFAETMATFGSLSALVNSAGIYRLGALTETTIEEVNEHIQINTLGPFLGMQAFASAADQGGAIVNVASTAALTGEAGSSAYSASKWALRGLTRVAAAELADRFIRVNCVLPGVVDSTMALENGSAVNAVTVAATPLMRMARAQDVAASVAYLLSEDAAFLSAAELVIDGGFTGAPRIDLLAPTRTETA
jgi:3alpha(or 20beta)-hydroxysteroid dehydrogenase